MKDTLCTTCKKPKAPYECELCHEMSCKACAQFLSEEDFAFSRKLSPELSHSTYCLKCFEEKVAGPLADYQATLEKAKEVIIFFKNQGQVTRLLQRKEKPYEVENCAGEDEAILKMSFYAVEDGFNALVDINMSQKKIIVGSHKKYVFGATAVPMFLDEKTLKQTSYERDA